MASSDGDWVIYMQLIQRSRTKGVSPCSKKLSRRSLYAGSLPFACERAPSGDHAPWLGTWTSWVCRTGVLPLLSSSIEAKCPFIAHGIHDISRRHICSYIINVAFVSFFMYDPPPHMHDHKGDPTTPDYSSLRRSYFFLSKLYGV